MASSEAAPSLFNGFEDAIQIVAVRKLHKCHERELHSNLPRAEVSVLTCLLPRTSRKGIGGTQFPGRSGENDRTMNDNGKGASPSGEAPFVQLSVRRSSRRLRVTYYEAVPVSATSLRRRASTNHRSAPTRPSDTLLGSGTAAASLVKIRSPLLPREKEPMSS